MMVRLYLHCQYPVSTTLDCDMLMNANVARYTIIKTFRQSFLNFSAQKIEVIQYSNYSCFVLFNIKKTHTFIIIQVFNDTDFSNLFEGICLCYEESYEEHLLKIVSIHLCEYTVV